MRSRPTGPPPQAASMEADQGRPGFFGVRRRIERVEAEYAQLAVRTQDHEMLSDNRDLPGTQRTWSSTRIASRRSAIGSSGVCFGIAESAFELGGDRELEGLGQGEQHGGEEGSGGPGEAGWKQESGQNGPGQP